jgi:hypothetical protein
MIKYDDFEQVKNSLDEFYSIYAERPIKDNQGGMKSPHLFNTWYALKQLQPKVVIESGVWKGLGTWIIEKAVPEAKIISIDITYQHLIYKSDKAIYLDQDMTSYDWDDLFSQMETEENISKNDILLFLDDHQDFLQRLEYVHGLGIQHILYEDNYPTTQGDTFSPKKILACRDYIMDHAGDRTHHKYSYAAYQAFDDRVEVYQEMPPIYKIPNTRWGDTWDDDTYNSPPPLLDLDTGDKYPTYLEEAPSYTWICYMGLKQ